MINSYDKIIGGLYVGDIDSGRVILQQKEPISHVISLVPVTKTLRRMLLKKSIVHIEHFIQNDENEDIMTHFNDLYPQIKEFLSNKEANLLVHCDLGKSRSVAVILLIMMKKFRYKFDPAYELIRLKRDVEINEKFLEEIKKYKPNKTRAKKDIKKNSKKKSKKVKRKRKEKKINNI